MAELKPLSKESLSNALEMAKHYRLLNQPWQAESICRDILMVEADHQTALVQLILALTDQFGFEKSVPQASVFELCIQIKNEYQRTYYTGLVHERLGTAALKRSTPRSKFIAYEHYDRAMNYFTDAEKISPEHNDESILRWNACQRLIEQFHLESATGDEGVSFLDV